MANEKVTIPLHAEKFTVTSEKNVTGKVTVETQTITEDATVDTKLVETSVKIQRIPINKFVYSVPDVRTEGDTVIVSLIKEVMVKRIFVTEEVHLTTVKVEKSHQETVSLKRQDANVTRHKGTADDQ